MKDPSRLALVDWKSRRRRLPRLSGTQWRRSITMLGDSLCEALGWAIEAIGDQFLPELNNNTPRSDRLASIHGLDGEIALGIIAE
jgi:hypothetical protein